VYIGRLFTQAALLVHRYYGGTRRLSEHEKRQLETLIAVRTQCTRDVWQRNLDRATRALDDEQQRARAERERARAGEAAFTEGLAAVRDAVGRQQREFDGEAHHSRRASRASPDSARRRRAGTGQNDQRDSGEFV